MPHPQSHLGCPIRTRSLRMSGVEAAPRDDTLIPSHPRRYQLPFPKRICLCRSSPNLTPNAVISILSEAEGPCTLPPQWRDPCIGFLLLPLLLLLLFSIPQESVVSAFALLVSIPEGNLRLPLLSQPHPKRCHLDRRGRTLPPQWRDPRIGFLSLPLLLPFLLSIPAGNLLLSLLLLPPPSLPGKSGLQPRHQAPPQRGL